MKNMITQAVRLPRNPWRLYLDTSVIGGCFDEEFSVDSRRVITAVLDGKARLLFTEVLEAELIGAPEPVRRLFEELPETCRERVAFTPEVESLAREYVARGVIQESWLEDCRHVAAANRGEGRRDCFLEFQAYRQAGQDQRDACFLDVICNHGHHTRHLLETIYRLSFSGNSTLPLLRA